MTEIDLDIVKAFDPTVIEVPQGSNQFFTITVTNNGPSDVVDAVVTDEVNSFLGITEPVLGSAGEILPGVFGTGSGTCTVDTTSPPPLATTDLECTVDIPAGESVVITVYYTVAPFLSGDQFYGGGTSDGSDFRFVFDNGSILEGTRSCTGLAGRCGDHRPAILV